MIDLTIGVDASRCFSMRPTGTERYSSEIVMNLLKIGSRHRWRLYRRSAAATELDELKHSPNVEIIALPARRAWTHTRLAWEVRRRPPDVLFVPSHVLPWRVTVPSVVTVHDLGHIAHPMAHTRLQRIYLELTTRHHVSRAAHLIADSGATGDDLVRHYGTSPARVSVVHLGVDSHFAPAPPAEIAVVRHEIGLVDGARYILHVGTLQPRKNLLRLIQAFAGIAPEHPGLTLVLAGSSGWGAEDYAGHASRLGVGDRVHFPGYVAEGKLAALYSGALLVAFPSLHEGFGLPVLEAMACGAPVAASAGSSIPEVAGDAALYFDPSKMESIEAALRGALNDPKELSRLARLGAERAAGFTWSRCAEQTLEILERIGSSRSRSGLAQ